jgi:glutamyl-tRNA reductase
VSLLVVGVSHHTAPVELLEKLIVSRSETPALLRRLLHSPYVSEAVIVSTCNRVEIWAAVSGFHGSLAEIGATLANRAGVPLASLTPALYVHFDADAVRHALRVAAGLDSMVVGEAQILGQIREAYRIATEHDTAGKQLHELMKAALRTGKRVHTETSIDAAGRSVVGAALELVPGGVRGRSVLVIGAGSMGALALSTVSRGGAAPLLVTSRTAERSQRLAQAYGASAVPLTDLTRHLSAVDIVICATASVSPVLSVERVSAAASRPLSIVDLAVPRDVEPGVGDLPDVTLVDISMIASAPGSGVSGADRSAAEAIVAAEVAGFQAWRRGADAAPAVAALRERADEIVTAELTRLWQRQPDLTEEQRAEFAHAVHRVVQRLLHRPTVRMRELAAGPDGGQYLAVMRELLDLSGSPTDLDRAVAIHSLDEGEVPA